VTSTPRRHGLGPPARRRWLILAVLVAAQFMVVLDAAVVNVALPSIQRALGFSEPGLAWVVNAYILTFGGFLLAGGRAADLLGHRRVFACGLVLFSLASLACGLAASPGQLVTLRAVQGLGAAVLSPAALAILVSTFSGGAERNAALGIWGAAAGAGATAGLLIGGVLTAEAGWPWVFFVNAPAGCALLILSRLVPSAPPARPRPALDLPGAVLATSGLCLLIYAVFWASEHGWGSPGCAGLLAGAAGLLAGFAAWERRSHSPLVPASALRLPGLLSACAINVLTGGILFATVFFLTLYLQRVLGYRPLQAGLAQLPLAGAQIVAARLAGQLATRFGRRAPLIAGLVTMTASLGWLALAPWHASYAADLAAPLVLFGTGLSLALVSIVIIGQAAVPGPLTGLASGLLNTALNLGGTLGLASLGGLAATRTRAALATAAAGSGRSAGAVPALTAGFHAGWAAAAGCALAAAALATRVRPTLRAHRAIPTTTRSLSKFTPS
jgi:EmrB/QacA subfamily drug resistance transporter